MNETTPKISVIVPVYKAEAYLHRCVDSILAQTFQDFEVLLIDDGSPDRSGEICDEYARKDRRVRVFHKENGGVSSARQCGLDNAQGEYTIHADPDDWVEPDMLEELYRKAKEENADMVICDYYTEEKGETRYITQMPSALDHETVLYELFFQKLYGSCWNKFVKRVCYKEYGIKFPLELSIYEDLYVNVCLIARGIKITYLHKAFYHYDLSINFNSLIHRSLESLFNQDKILQKLLNNDVYVMQYDRIKVYLMFRLAYKSLIIGGSYLRDFTRNYIILKKRIFKLPVAGGVKTKIIFLLAFFLSPQLAHFIYAIRYHNKR